MAMVGFSFTKINAERTPADGQAVTIESNASISNVSEMHVIDPKKMLLRFEFIFMVKYSPTTGKIELNGEVVQLYDKDLGSKVLDYWKSEKKILPEIMKDVFNVVLAKSNVEALIISRDMDLPSPIQMPRIDMKPSDVKMLKSGDSKPTKSDSKAESKVESKESKPDKGKK